MTEPGRGQLDDAVIACARLAARSGASDFEIGYTGDEDRPDWWMSVHYRGVRFTVERHATPTGAAMALAERLLRGARCRCRKTVAVNGKSTAKYCRWRLVGDGLLRGGCGSGEPGCTAPPIKVEGDRGDLAAMQRAIEGKEPQR